MRNWWIATLAASLLGFAGLFAASEYIVRYKVEPNDHFWRNVDLFFSSKSTAAAFGDSLVAHGFHGVDGFANLGVPGESPPITELKLAAYFASRKPDRVLIALNPNVFNRPSQIDLGSYEDIYVARRRPLIRALIPRHRGFMFRYWLVWLRGTGFHNNYTVPPEGGILMARPSANENYAKMSAAVRQQDAAADIAGEAMPATFRASKNLETLARMVRFAKAKGGEVCLVTFPYSAEYRRAAENYPQFKEALSYFPRFAEHAGVRYVSFWDRFDDATLFLDPTHLSEAGARRFSVLAVRECFGE